MIRISPIPEPPAILVGPDSPAAKERKEAAAYWKANKTMKGFPFKVYKNAEVVAALESVFNGKCAYCEFRYDGGAPCDVEHYRPKGGVYVDGELKEPGYYWLAADWMNLLPSCVDCNRQRYHDFGDDDPEIRGKANIFPIENPAKRAKKPGAEVGEERVLLHPYLDEPRDFLTFIENGVIQALQGPDGQPKERGLVSIRTYGLDRPNLSKAREDVWVRIAGYVKRAKRHLGRVAANPASEEARVDLDEAIADLRRELSARALFLGMVRQLAEPVRELVN